MPTVRYQIRNEYGLADPEVYRAVDKDDPEALLEGVAMAGLVGVLRQLGDLSEFAAEVFHNLHEEVMATSARGHGLMLRVLQLEAEFPSIEKAILSETDHSHCAYSAGIDWHASVRVEQNLVSQGDMPRFILDSYEECRGPPRLFMLDKFDVAGAGACLTRYSNPSFFKTASAFSEMMEEAQREKRARKPKKKGSNWRSGETTESFFTPIIDHLQFAASESVPRKFPAWIVKLKHRKFRLTDISNRKSYMEDFLKEESFVQNDSKSSLIDCPNNKILDGAPEVQEVLTAATSDPLLVKKESSPPSLKEVTGKVLNQKRENGELLETVSTSSCVSQEFYPNSQSAKETMLMGLGNEMGIHAFDINSDEINTNPSLLQLAVQNNIFAVSGFITDDEPDSYRSDDIGSELENYVDALSTMESEIEADLESRVKPDPSLFKRESQGTDPNVNGQLELEPRSLKSTILFDSPVDLPDHNETCDEKQPNAAMVVPLSGEAFSSYCLTDSDLKSQPNLQEAQSLIAHPDDAISGRAQNSSEIDEHIESSFLPWQTNHIVVSPTFEERPDIPTDVLEEMNPIEYSEDGIPLNVSEMENGILSVKAPSDCSEDLSTSLDDGIGKPLEVPEPDKNDYIFGSSSQSAPAGSTVLESQDSSNVMEIGVQSIDLAMKVSPNYMVDEVKERKQLNSNVLLSKDGGSPRSSQTSENINDIIAFISDERGSPLGSQNNSVLGQLSGYNEENMFNVLANTLEMVPQATQTQAESSLLSLEIVSSVVQSESYPTEIGKISATHEEFEHPQLLSSSRNIDILGCDDLISYELQESSNDVMLEPLPSSFREDPDANQLHCEVTESIETNGEESVHDGLEFANDSSKLGVQHDLLLLGESKNNSFTGNGIPKDNINDQVLNIVESAKVTTFDVLLQEDPPHQNYPDIEEPALTRDSTSLDSENKSYLLFTENQEIEMFFNSVSKSQTSASLDAKLADGKEDKLCSRVNVQDPDSKSENFIAEDDTDGNILSLSQPSNVNNFDEQFQEDLVSEDLNGASSDSKVSIVTPDATDGRILHLLESSNLNSFDEQIQKDSVSEDASLNQLKPENQEAAIESDLTSNKLPAPLCENASVSQAVDEPTIAPLYRLLENVEPSYIHSHEVSSQGVENGEHPPLELEPEALLNHGCRNESNMSSSKACENDQTETNLSVSFQGASEHPGSYMASEALASRSPPLPPLPPMQWRMGKLQLGSRIANPFICPSNIGSHMVMDEDNQFTVALSPSPEDVIPQHPGLLEAGDPQAIKERRPKLVKLLPGLEFERSQEAPIKDRDAIPPLGSFMFMPTAGDGMYQYGYEGSSMHYHNLSATFPVAVQAYHMFLREGNSSAVYDIMLQDMEGDNPNEKHHSILSRPRDPLIEAVAAHDKSTLRKVSELDRPLRKPNEDENNHLLEQIKTKSLNLKPATSKANVAKAPSTNLKVAAMLEKANAIRQACVGSDEDDDDDSWNDS